MKVLGTIQPNGKNKWIVKLSPQRAIVPFTCCALSNVGVTRKLNQFAVSKTKLEVWIRDEDSVLLGVRLK